MKRQQFVTGLTLFAIMAFGFSTMADEDENFKHLVRALEEKKITTIAQLLEFLPNASKISAFIDVLGIDEDTEIVTSGLDPIIAEGQPNLVIILPGFRDLTFDFSSGSPILYCSYPEWPEYLEDTVSKSDATKIANKLLKAINVYPLIKETDFEFKDNTYWEATVWRVYRGFKHINSYIIVRISPKSGEILSFRDTPFLVPETVDQNISAAQAVKIAEEFALSILSVKTEVSVKGESDNIRQYIMNCIVQRKDKDGAEHEVPVARLIWDVLVTNSLDIRFFVKIDCATGEVLGYLY